MIPSTWPSTGMLNKGSHLKHQSGEEEQPLLAKERHLGRYLRGHLPPYLQSPKRIINPQRIYTKRSRSSSGGRHRRIELRRDLGCLPSYVHRHGRRTRRDWPLQLLLGDAITSMLRSAHHASVCRIPGRDRHLPGAEEGGRRERGTRNKAANLGPVLERGRGGRLKGGAQGISRAFSEEQRGGGRRPAACVRPGSRGVGSRHGSSEKSGDRRQREAMVILEKRWEWRGFMWKSAGGGGWMKVVVPWGFPTAFWHGLVKNGDGTWYGLPWFSFSLSFWVRVADNWHG
jgi:hypothetical protein